ncbi:hypothetical protein [Candidatus Nitrospira bockiana]
MLAVTLLIGLMVFTWAAAVWATFNEETDEHGAGSGASSQSWKGLKAA